MYRRYPLATLGPRRCQGCGEPLWWARRMSRRLGINTLRFGWREDDGTLHHCPSLRSKMVEKMSA